MKLLISKDNIAEFRPIAKELDSDRLNPFIQESQNHDLRRLLGNSFYMDFMSKFDSIGDPKQPVYAELLNGKTYTIAGITIEYQGLIGFLSYTSLARYYSGGDIHATRFGLVKKKNSDGASEPISREDKAAEITALKSIANSYKEDIVKFLLDQNSLTANASYPLFAFSKGDGREVGGVKFFDTDANSLYGSGNARSNGRTNISY